MLSTLRGAPASDALHWPADRVLPVFAKPAETLDALVVQTLRPDEQITFSALQGLVNRKQPRFILLDEHAGEGRDTWLRTETNGITDFRIHNPDDRYRLIAGYAKELRGVVLYDTARGEHFRNLASTVAGIETALPVTRGTLDAITAHGWKPDIIADLTGLELSSAIEVYQHMREKWWPRCEKRVILSARPYDKHGDLHHTRDMAVACGAAVVWLDPRDKKERALLASFFRDMPAGEAVALGWYETERSGVTTASAHGIGTMPSDFFNGSTVFAGAPADIRIPPVPKMPALENKVYIAAFISDGDNIQYVQHAMRMFWDRSEPLRGRVPLNWTIAPGLVDIAPGLMNYYYTTATPADCFVSGPSGMGYVFPCNTLEEPGAPVGRSGNELEPFQAYARLTGRYTSRAGLRVVTIWDDADAGQRAAYERNCPHLYGLTVQNFRDVPSVAESVEGGRLRFEKLRIPYAGSFEDLRRDAGRAIHRWDGKESLFLAYQMDIWSDMKPHRIVELHDVLRDEHPGKVEFVRADHFYNLRNQAQRLPYNLCLDPGTKVRASSGDAALATDGTPATAWKPAGEGEAWIAFDFGAPRSLARYVIHHAAPGARPDAVAFQTSKDGRTWRSADVCRGSSESIENRKLTSVTTRYARLLVKSGTLPDVEIHGAGR